MLIIAEQQTTQMQSKSSPALDGIHKHSKFFAYHRTKDYFDKAVEQRISQQRIKNNKQVTRSYETYL